MGLLDRVLSRLGYTLATEVGYASGWSDNSHLADIALADFLGFAEDYVLVNRATAMQISTIAAGRNTIAGIGGRLPLYAEQGGIRAPQQPALLSQPERGIPRTTSMQWLYDSLLFYPHAWWHVIERDFYKWPTKVERVEQSEARLDDKGRLIAIGNRDVKPEDVIRFDSPLGAGLLIDGANRIKRAYAIEAAAALAEDNPVPTVELHNEGADLNDTEREVLLTAWSAARRKRGVAYTPKNLKAIAHGQQTEQLLIAGRKQLNLDLVRQMNLPAWAASNAVEGATMTYDNRQLRNWELIDITLGGYFAAITGRLSMPDVTPRGWEVKVGTDDLTRPDQKTRFETYRIGLGDKKTAFIDTDWIAAQESWPVTPGGSK